MNARNRDKQPNKKHSSKSQDFNRCSSNSHLIITSEQYQYIEILDDEEEQSMKMQDQRDQPNNATISMSISASSPTKQNEYLQQDQDKHSNLSMKSFSRQTQQMESNLALANISQIKKNATSLQEEEKQEQLPTADETFLSPFYQDEQNERLKNEYQQPYEQNLHQQLACGQDQRENATSGTPVMCFNKIKLIQSYEELQDGYANYLRSLQLFTDEVQIVQVIEKIKKRKTQMRQDPRFAQQEEKRLKELSLGYADMFATTVKNHIKYQENEFLCHKALCQTAQPLVDELLNIDPKGDFCSHVNLKKTILINNYQQKKITIYREAFLVKLLLELRVCKQRPQGSNLFCQLKSLLDLSNLNRPKEKIEFKWGMEMPSSSPFIKQITSLMNTYIYTLGYDSQLDQKRPLTMITRDNANYTQKDFYHKLLIIENCPNQVAEAVALHFLTTIKQIEDQHQLPRQHQHCFEVRTFAVCQDLRRIVDKKKRKNSEKSEGREKGQKSKQKKRSMVTKQEEADNNWR